jgi:hypothetical protein
MFLDDAELKTESWRLRHSPEAIRTLGVWRWKGMQRHMERILSLCVGKRVIDFGGADGPLGLGSEVVDRQAKRKSIAGVGQVDVIFTSHTLEHLSDPKAWIIEACYRLVDNGYLIIHVPAWTCKRWRAGEYHNDRQTDHRQTFCLSVEDNRPYGTPIDGLMAKLFDIELAEHCGDNSLMVIGRKR